MTIILTPHVKRELRAQQTANMSESCEVSRAVKVAIAGGRFATTYPRIDIRTNCRVEALGAEEAERFRAGRRDVALPYRVVFPLGTDLRATDRLHISGTTDTGLRPVAWTKTLSVDAIEPTDTSNAACVRVLASVIP